jgi:hypothetical protein
VEAGFRRRRTGGGELGGGGRCSGAQTRGEGGRGGACQPGERSAPFYKRSKAVGMGIFLSSRSFDGRQWRWKYPGVDPSGEVLGRDSRRGVNVALWDGTGRPATRWWQAAGRGGGVGWRRRLGQAPWWPPSVREWSRNGPVLEQ